jgi:hypothetical protein
MNVIAVNYKRCRRAELLRSFQSMQITYGSKYDHAPARRNQDLKRK